MPDFGWESDVEEAEPEEDSAEEANDDAPTEKLVCSECEDTVKVDGVVKKPFDSSDAPVICEDCQEDDEPEPVNENIPEEDREKLKAQTDAESDSEPDGAEDTEPEPEPVSDRSDPVEIEANDEALAEAEEAVGDGSGEDPFADLAGGSMDLTEASEQEERRRIMLWGPPATGKTHACFTARKPLALIDTERKSSDLAEKFDVDPSRVRIWPVSDWEELEAAVDEALAWLRAWHNERGERGTLAVDSMSDVWEWAKVDYIHKYYIEPDPTGKYEDPSDVDLKSALEANDPDWPKIKQQHNDLRSLMVESPFDLVWTAMAKEDYNEKIKTGSKETPYTWHGETNNDHKVNYILRHREDADGQPLADLRKPGTTQHSFAGLEWPTLPKAFEVIEDIKAAENAPEPVPPGEIEDEHGVELVKGKPSKFRGVGGDGDE